MKPGLVLTVNPAITYGVFERVKGLVLAREGRVGGRLSVGESFWIGVASKTLATVVTYPYIFVSPGRSGGRFSRTTRTTKLMKQAKVRLQAKSSKSKSQPQAQIQTSSTEKPSHEETYADIASHPASATAPVVTHNPELDSHGDVEKQSSSHLSNTAKKAVQSDGGAIELLTRVYREKGLGGWYKGLGAQIVKAVLCQGTSYPLLHFFAVSNHVTLHRCN